MNRFGTLALSAGALAAGALRASAATLVYSSLGQFNEGHQTQQSGNNSAYLGDDVHLSVACPQVANVYIDFGYFTYDSLDPYTPNIQVDLFRVDSDGFPVDSNTNDTFTYTPIATAFNNSVTFIGDNYNNGGRIVNTKQTVCFDFSTQTGAQNLQDFAFGYRDINPAGQVYPGFGFAVFTSSTGPQLGSSGTGILDAAPNDLGSTSFGAVTGVNSGSGNAISMSASITCVPEPASVGILSLVSVLALRRRKA